MSKHTDQTLDRIERDVERDFIMNAKQAKEYGIIDEIIDRHATRGCYSLTRPLTASNGFRGKGVAA